MPNQLAELTNASTETLIPHHILTPPTLADHGRVEREFRILYLNTVAEGCKSFPAAIQEKMALTALEHIRDGLLTYPRRAYNNFVLSAEGLHIIAMVSLQAKHPQIRLADAKKLVDEHNNNRKLAEAIWDLWDYPRTATGEANIDPKGVDWESVLQRLMLPQEKGGWGMSAEDVGKLTGNQLHAMLADSSPRQASHAEVEAKKKQARHDLFDRIAIKQEREKSEIATAPIEQWQAWVRDEVKGPVDLTSLDRDIKAWAGVAASRG